MLRPCSCSPCRRTRKCRGAEVVHERALVQEQERVSERVQERVRELAQAQVRGRAVEHLLLRATGPYTSYNLFPTLSLSRFL